MSVYRVLLGLKWSRKMHVGVAQRGYALPDTEYRLVEALTRPKAIAKAKREFLLEQFGNVDVGNKGVSLSVISACLDDTDEFMEELESDPEFIRIMKESGLDD